MKGFKSIRLLYFMGNLPLDIEKIIAPATDGIGLSVAVKIAGLWD